MLAILERGQLFVIQPPGTPRFLALDGPNDLHLPEVAHLARHTLMLPVRK